MSAIVTQRHVIVAGVLALLSACTPKVEKYFDSAALPEQVVPLHDEVLAYKAKDPASKQTKQLRLDIRALLKDSSADAAVIAPFDEEQWYEPIPIRLQQGRAKINVALNRDFLVVLDFGEWARNGYHAITQLNAASGLLPPKLKPRICQLVLCPAEKFSFAQMPERIPELKNLGFDIGSALPPLTVGPVGRSGSICENCFDREPNIIPCILWKWCGEFPLRRRIHVRKNISKLTPAEINTLRRGVDVMKRRDPADPTSWWYQAKMHAVDSGTAAALQDQCQHRQFLFFSWHRMYLYYFERILRKASGDPQFAQPYWNYTDDTAQAAIPEPYRLPADETSNALYNGSRQQIYNDGTPLPAADVSYTSAWNQTSFTTTLQGVPSFGGRTVTSSMHFPIPSPGSGEIERSPHNNVHNDISGDMASGESPRDPVFWLHHANIDRLWKRWLQLGGGRTNPIDDSFWMTHVFTFFDENGAQVNLTGAQILNTVAQLDYRYDDDPFVFWPVATQILTAFPTVSPEAQKMAAANTSAAPQPLASTKRLVRLTDSRVDATVKLPEVGRTSLAQALQSDSARDRIVLQLNDIRFDAPVGMTYLLFLNVPSDATNLDSNHSHYIGTLGFFGQHGREGHAAGGGVSEHYDITRVLQKIKPAGDLVITAIPSRPTAPANRKDLQEQVAAMKPKGNPRFGEIVLLRVPPQ